MYFGVFEGGYMLQGSGHSYCLLSFSRENFMHSYGVDLLVSTIYCNYDTPRFCSLLPCWL